MRLGCEAPDGSIEQVCEGILNLTHRDLHAVPTPLVPGRVYEVRVPLRAAGYRFPRAHRIHLSLASAHWPVVWPSPGVGELSLHRGPETPSRLELPLAPAGAELVPVPPAILEGPSEAIRDDGSEVSEPIRWEIVEDPETGDVSVRTHEASTTTLPDGVSRLYVGETLAMTASGREPGHGQFENTCDYRLDQEGRHIGVIADGTTIATSTSLEMTVGIRVDLDGERIFERTWREEVPRDLG